MSVSSHRNLGGRRPYYKQRKRTKKSKISSRKGFWGKKNKEYQQNKHKLSIIIFLTSNPRPESEDLINLYLPILVENSILEAQLAVTTVLQVQWEAKNKVILDGKELVTCQRQRCKDFGLIVFGFAWKKAQVDAIWTLFFEKKDLLLFAKTSFGKSLIFQLILFYFEFSGIIIILMLLKLFQVEQNTMINRIAQGKAIVLTRENNQKDVQQSIASQNYTHVFTIPKIALSKKLKMNVLDDPRFSNRLLLLAIDKTPLVDKWGKVFWPFYIEIKKD